MKASKFNEQPQLRLDAADAPSAPPVILVKLDGKDHVQGSAAHVAALEAKFDAAVKAHADALAAKDAELGQLKAKLDAVPAPVDTEKLVQDELDFRASMLPLVGKDYAFKGKSRSDVRYDAVGTEAATKIRALPEGQREGYLQALLDAKSSVADRPTHAPAPGAVSAVKADEASKKYNPYAVLNQAFADARK